jgi:hypothetical protein
MQAQQDAPREHSRSTTRICARHTGDAAARSGYITGPMPRRMWIRVAAFLTLAIFLVFLLLRRGRLW